MNLFESLSSWYIESERFKRCDDKAFYESSVSNKDSMLYNGKYTMNLRKCVESPMSLQAGRQIPFQMLESLSNLSLFVKESIYASSTLLY